MRGELRVSFALSSVGEEGRHAPNRTASQRYNTSFTLSHNGSSGVLLNRLPTPRSPLYPENIVPEEHRPKQLNSSETPASHEPIADAAHNSPTALKDTAQQQTPAPPLTTADPDPAHGAILIYPKKIDNLRRFRILFVGVLLFISSSAQGMHSLFGTLYLQTVYRFSVREMAVVYLCGQAAGMFVFPFGALYDWFGPRVVVAAGSVVAALGHLLFALAFSGHIAVTVPNCAVFYAVMCWGCYALDVTVLPAVLSHMPRDRGQPTGLLETFSGLGSSFFSCLFRGFFGNNFANLMWFLFAVTVAAGVAGTWYLEDAPYVVNRWQQRRITPREQLRKYLIRNRYMSQLVPQRRYAFMTVILILLNFYLTIQAVVVAYLASEMTDGKRRGIAVGAIVIVLLILILVVPVDAIDGPTEQDKQVIEAARAKEEELRTMQEERYRQRHLKARAHRRQEKTQEAAEDHEVDNPSHEPLCVEQACELRLDTDSSAHPHLNPHASCPLSFSNGGTNTEEEDEEEVVERKASPIEVPVPPADDRLNTEPAASPSSPRRRGGVLSNAVGLPLYEPTDPERTLLTVYMDDEGEERDDASGADTHAPAKSCSHRRQQSGEGGAAPPHPSHPPKQSSSSKPDNVFDPQAGGEVNAVDAALPRRQSSFTVRVERHGAAATWRRSPDPHRCPIADSQEVEFTAAPPSTYDNPRVETVTLCGEVYVAPVYQTTFLESLTYLDMWMIAYTTLCVWGVGLTMVGNWNIYIMLLARYGGMEQKHYILFAAMAGVSTAGGRVFLGMYERILQILRERTGIIVVPTLLYPVTSVGLLIGTIFWIALPGDKVLVLAYLIGPAFYGISSSITPYVLGTIFDRDLGMHYGFCFLAGAIGFVLCYWCSWYLTYREETVLTPRGYLCVGQRRCMNRAVGIYVALVFSSVISSYIVHRRYSKLVSGKLAHRRVIVPRIKKIFQACGCGSDNAAKSVKKV